MSNMNGGNFPIIGIKDMARDSALAREKQIVIPSAGLVAMDSGGGGGGGGGIGNDKASTSQSSPSAASVTDDMSQQILELKQKQEMQKQKLWFSFQEQKHQLEIQHQLELEQRIKHKFQELRDQRIAEEQQMREKRERESLRRKEKTDCSANASTEVKQKLQNFLMQKKQAANGLSLNNSGNYRGWGVIKSSSGESLPNSGASAVHPYKIPQPQSIIVKYDSDYPLRKTASEPNLLKIRLKQSVIERKARIGPFAAKRHERILAAHRRSLKHHSQVPNNSMDSGPNSPPSIASRTSPSGTIAEENEAQVYNSESRANINDLALFSSPSMPNISLGRSHLLNAHNLSQVALLASMQHSSSTHSMQQQSSPFISPLDLTDPRHKQPPTAPSSSSSSSSLVMQQQQQQQQQQQSVIPPNSPQLCGGQVVAPGHLISRPPLTIYGHPITDSQVAHARLYKQGHRPLGRTQSAPLPLGHPMLTGQMALNISPTHYENSEAERQAYEQQMLLKQRLRPSAFSRSGSNHTLKEEEPLEAIDLTDKREEPKTVIIENVQSMNTDDGPSTASLAEEKLRLDQHVYLQQQRELLMRNTHIQFTTAAAAAAAAAAAHTSTSGGDVDEEMIRPLSRTLSSPLVHHCPPAVAGMSISKSVDDDTHIPPVNLSAAAAAANNTTSSSIVPRFPNEVITRPTTGLAFDNLMLKHSCMCGNNAPHPEHSGRLQSIWARLVETGLASRCDRLRSRKATQEELQSVHSEAHATLFGASQINKQKVEASRVTFVRLACGGVGVDLDTTWNEHHTAPAARMAVGCVVDLAFKTARGDVKNGFAVVRPPGHHAEPNAAMGFCFFNSVAIAARLLRQKMPEVKKILILDWDVHHGNGTQQIFYDDPDILYLSIHRHDDGNFFPGTGGPIECGVGAGLGFNVNIAWSGGLNPPLGDTEYLAAFRTVVLPIARDFAPDIILVSAGFDAAAGHPAPLGGYVVSPACFGHLTRQLMKLANGKLILALEGGYDLPAICDSAQECVKALLGDEPGPIAEIELKRPPCLPAIETLQKTIAIQLPYWPSLKALAHTISMSMLDAQNSEKDESETVSAMAGLSMQPPDRTTKLSTEEPMDEDEK